MQILILGGTGNISAESAELLHRSGHEIVLLNRGKGGIPKEYRAIQADRHERDQMRKALAGLEPDVVINFIGYEVADVQLDFDLLAGRTAQYVFISSTTVHSRPPGKLPITEDAPIGNAYWEYARKKAACEEWLLEQWQTRRFPVTIVRPSHTYSKRWIPNAISSGAYNFAARLEAKRPVFVHDGGRTPWTLTAASDFSSGLAGLLGRKDVLGEAFHITSDEVLTWSEIYATIAEALGVGTPHIHSVPTNVICEVAPGMTGTLKGDKAHPGVFDNSKLRRFVPGFACRKTLREGIRESVEWLRSNPAHRRLDPVVERNIEAVLGRVGIK